MISKVSYSYSWLLALCLQFFISFIDCTYDPYLKQGTEAVAGTTLAFFNDRGLVFFAVGDVADGVQLSWFTPRDTEALTEVLPNDITLAERADLAALNFGTSVEYGADHVTDNMLFIGSVQVGTTTPGVVYYYRGDFRTWTVQQILKAPKDDLADNAFGNAIDLDPFDLRTFAVGCKNCNSSGTDVGSVILFEPFSPQASQWTQSQILTATSLYYLGGTDVEMYDELVLADYCTAATPVCATPSHKVMLFERIGDHWDPRQTLGYKTPGDFSPTDYSVASFAVYDDTIVLGVSEYSITYATPAASVGAVYVLQPGIPPGKPQPRQWSIQQILFADTPTASDLFGADVSIDGNTMVVADGQATADLYVFQRETPVGKWSLQQKITGVGTLTALELRGSAFSTVESGELSYYHSTNTWDCVIIQLNDHFGDGWDVAQLIVEVPEGVQTLLGDIDHFEPRCDIPNPITFRYCPKDASDVGPYRISVKDGVAAKHHWEILWRVYEERTGIWFTGKWDTTLDMVWTKDHQFEVKKSAKTLPWNITCQKCPPRPTSKPSPPIRYLKGGDDSKTHAPTISPAPTVEVTNNQVNWRFMTLETASAPWFDYRHIGASYYVSDAQAHKLLHVGTMCADQVSPLNCWIDLPDGIYTVRVGGDLSADKADFTWYYCKAANPLNANTQIVIEVANDDCQILARHNSDTYCNKVLKFDASVIVNVQLLILGAIVTTSDHHSGDILAVREALSNVIPGLELDDVKVISITNSDQGVFVNAHILLKTSTTGYHLTDYDGYLSLKNLQSYLENDGGKLLRAGVAAGTQANSFSSATNVILIGFQVFDSVDIPFETEIPYFGAVDYADTPTQDYVEDNSNQFYDVVSKIITGVSLMGYVIAGTVALFLGIIISSRIGKMRKAKQTMKQLHIHSDYTAQQVAMESAEYTSDSSENNNHNADLSTLKITKKSSKSSGSDKKKSQSKKVSY